MSQQFGVVKPADKGAKFDKKAKKPERAADGGKHKPLLAEMQKLQNDERKAKEEAKVAHQKKKEQEKKQAVEAAKAEKFGDIWAYADEKKKQHSLPDDLHQQIRSCQTKGEAKRIVKAYLQKIQSTQPA